MLDKIANDARIYTDVQSLENLRYQSGKNSDSVKKEVSKQFESMLMQIVISSMRDANKAFSSDLFGSDQMDFYEDMFDKQLSLLTSNSGTGFAQIIEKNIDQQYVSAKSKTAVPAPSSHDLTLPDIRHIQTVPMQSKRRDPVETVTAQATPVQTIQVTKEPSTSGNFNSQNEFIHTIWSSAKSAAKVIGVDPKLLLAQAALETNWGKKILPQGKDNSSYNLFNIKADTSWNKQTITTETLEQKNGILSKEKAKFRSYDSFMDSFMDYVHFLKDNNRYSEALKKAADPQQFIHALQNAGFATDTNYAEKILRIFSSQSFKALVAKLE
jgi:flagellar protein FlgJ